MKRIKYDIDKYNRKGLILSLPVVLQVVNIFSNGVYICKLTVFATNMDSAV